MAQVQRHRRAIAAGLLGLLALAVAPALAEDREPNAGTELYDRPVLAIDPGMHTAEIRAQAVDAAGQFAVTSSDDRTMRVWSIADVKVVRTIWIPIGPKPVGSINSVAISPDGSTIAAGGFTERLTGSGNPIYIFDRESGNLVRRIGRDLPNVTHFLTFSPDGRYLAATMGGGHGLRVFDRGKDWSETFREDHYGDDSYGAAFARDGRLATTAWDGMIRLYAYDPANVSPNFRRVRESVSAPSGHLPRGVASVRTINCWRSATPMSRRSMSSMERPLSAWEGTNRPTSTSRRPEPSASHGPATAGRCLLTAPSSTPNGGHCFSRGTGTA
jgi:hypothetical protein